MKVHFFLTVNSRGSVRTTKNRVSLDWDEVSIGMSIDLPDALFSKPQLSAAIVVPDSAVNVQTIAAEVRDNIQGAIEQAAGMEVRLEFVQPEKVE